jgi:hypothetical protein
MNFNTHGLLVVAFAMGSGSALMVERLMISSPDDVNKEQIVVAEITAEQISPKPAWPYLVTSSDDNADRSSSEVITAGESDQPTSTASTAECEPSGQQKGDDAQEYSYLAEGDELDPALQEERYAFEATAQDQEEQRILEEANLAREEETSLYDPPPDSFEMSAEEQGAMEHDSVNESMADATVEEDPFLQQVLENEARMNALDQDQNVGGLEEKEE